jgi:hypothetical protein
LLLPVAVAAAVSFPQIPPRLPCLPCLSLYHFSFPWQHHRLVDVVIDTPDCFSFF